VQLRPSARVPLKSGVTVVEPGVAVMNRVPLALSPKVRLAWTRANAISIIVSPARDDRT
jgi:hypothetical protein